MREGLPPLREVIARHGLSASKALGQNFLLDEQLLDRIARVPGPLAGARVYEVGPGPGGLTRALLRAGARVVAVERDRRCLPALAELGEAAAGAPARSSKATRCDRCEPPAGAHIVANLPYNVGTALLVRWLGGEAWPPVEIADPDVPAGGGRADRRGAGQRRLWPAVGARPVAVRRAKLAMKVHRSAFVPPPKVMSAVVHIVPGSAARGRHRRGARAAHRRRLRPAPQDAAQRAEGLPGALDALEALGIDPERRAETLAVGGFRRDRALLTVMPD